MSCIDALGQTYFAVREAADLADEAFLAVAADLVDATLTVLPTGVLAAVFLAAVFLAAGFLTGASTLAWLAAK